MKHHFTWPILILLLALTGCAHHRTTDEHAKAFFEDGRSYILKSLKKQDASREQLDSAKAILDREEAEVTRHIAASFHAQKDVLFAVTTGKDSATLVPLENSAHQAQAEAVRSIGQMHEALQTAVGPDMWKATMLGMEKKMARYIRRK
jgi:hypothetical protein